MQMLGIIRLFAYFEKPVEKWEQIDILKG